jgi:hypothetical protein
VSEALTPMFRATGGSVLGENLNPAQRIRVEGFEQHVMTAGARQGAVMKQEKAGSCTGFCMVIIIRNVSLYFGTVEEESQRATFFFVVFYCISQSGFL